MTYLHDDCTLNDASGPHMLASRSEATCPHGRKFILSGGAWVEIDLNAPPATIHADGSVTRRPWSEYGPEGEQGVR